MCIWGTYMSLENDLKCVWYLPAQEYNGTADKNLYNDIKECLTCRGYNPLCKEYVPSYKIRYGPIQKVPVCASID